MDSSHASTSLSGVHRARQAFFVEGGDPGAGLPSHIARSWRRCSAHSPIADLAEPVQRGELSARREAASWLRRCAEPELDALAEHAVGQGCVVILTDATGLILDEVGSPEFLPKAHRIALAAGVEWSESRRGTNAIGTALQERQALMVLGGEHFLARNGALGCAAAPIFDARGALAGALDVSGESIKVNEHALGLVRLAASQVEHRMMSAAAALRPGQGLLRFHRQPGLVGTSREALLSIEDGLIVGANRRALALLGLDWSDALGLPAARIFGTRWERLQHAPDRVAAPDGRQWIAALDTTAARRPVAMPAARSVPLEQQDALDPLLARAGRLLAEGLSILVTGETGSGKEVFVRRLHQASRRASGPLVAVNCAALPEGLIEAELFGYEDGAFTGARRRGQAGRLREAQGGLLFLDEVGDMPLAMQTRLLRVLEDRVVRPLGSSREFAIDFDLVCATHRDLPALVRSGGFREDLFYRLQGEVVAIPPLRQRPDRRALIQRLFDEAGARRKELRLTDEALALLSAQPWPGNVRELQAALRRLAALSEAGTTLGEPELAAALSLASCTASPAHGEATLAALADEAIRQALGASHGNVAAAARLLGVHRSTLYRQLARKP
ncbi:sigma-54-dependent Fis family transcriptional regulator [Paucibacter sp. R3-3]|uniref:Sigma-54-dependent Fis family transcriptional regulator n=1 Tax=Roseateles agri TaxID=3098619 RepID=A0ABU5DFW4_9BURK|nr:sigma-54-dependent Fis family transcriptional regulator [Paucibacter sp. R3-3]MDY0744648.1 sigma-54-dependent Fis family transcriptional regulator [Paucibacter sp. R3-3]